MRISDWSSDVCSSDLADAPLGFHQSAASAPKCAASAASIVGVEAVIGNPWDVLLRKQEPREACASPGTLGSCLRRNTDPSRAAPPSSTGPAPLPRERTNLRRNQWHLSPPQADITRHQTERASCR